VGVEKSVYVGPYFEVSYPKKSNEADQCKNKDECPDKSGEESRRSIPNSWCSKCGIKLCERFRTWSYRADFLEIFDNKERLHAIKDDDDEDEGDMYTDFLVPNIRPSSTPREFEADISQEIAQEDRGTELLWLRRCFKDEHVILKEKFGDANVHVCWGVLVWWR